MPHRVLSAIEISRELACQSPTAGGVTIVTDMTWLPEQH